MVGVLTINQERSWSSGNAFDKLMAHGEMVASKAGWHKESLGNLGIELTVVTHPSSVLITALIPLAS